MRDSYLPFALSQGHEMDTDTVDLIVLIVAVAAVFIAGRVLEHNRTGARRVLVITCAAATMAALLVLTLFPPDLDHIDERWPES
jgi:predicted MFS family arabinose efflux permease